MDIKLEKYKPVEWLIGLKDEDVISKIKEVRSENESSWSAEISEAEKISITAGLKDVENGNTFSHEQIMKEVSKSYDL